MHTIIHGTKSELYQPFSDSLKFRKALRKFTLPGVVVFSNLRLIGGYGKYCILHLFTVTVSGTEFPFTSSRTIVTKIQNGADDVVSVVKFFKETFHCYHK